MDRHPSGAQHAEHENALSEQRITPHFHGIWVPMVTPFRHGEVDLDAARLLARDLATSGAHGIVLCGTTGEAATLSDVEQQSLLQAVLRETGPHLPLVMGVGGNDTRALARKIEAWNDQPLAGLLISPPAYVRPSQHGIVQHFRALAAATDHSIILYNIPARSGVNIEPATVLELSGDSHFVAIKESAGDVRQLTALLLDTGIDVLCGDDTLLLATLCLGGHGAISAAAHIRPDLYAQLYHLVQHGRIAEARILFRALLPMITLLFSEPNPGPLKAALALQGKIGNELRLPMTPMSTAGTAQLAQALERLLALPRWSAPASPLRHGGVDSCLLKMVAAASVVPAGMDDDHHRH
jgi:4-hydroxy-tetrahydrodipicolinate synthase